MKEDLNAKLLYEFNSYYESKLIPGIAPTAQVVDLTFKNFAVTAYNPNNNMTTADNPMLTNKNIEYHGGVTGYNPIQDNDDDGLGIDLETEIKWLKNANIVNLQDKRDLQEKIKNYKKFIKMLLEDL